MGREGYAFLAEEHYDGDMFKTYKNISVILDEKQKTSLGWQAFQGTAEEYRELGEKILDIDGNIKPEYIGMEGYALFAKEHYAGNMQKTYKNISAILNKKKKTELDWQTLQGTAEEYKKLREKILDTEGNIQPKYIGMKGYALLAEEHYDGNMQKTYINVSAILGGVNRTRELGLGWKFQGAVDQFYGL